MENDKPKHPSGAQIRAKRRAREAAYQAKLSGTVQERVAVYQRLGPPPADPIGRMEWANHLLSLLAWQTVTDEAITDEPTRRRAASDMLFKVGATTGKALYERRMKQIEQRLGIAAAQEEDVSEERPANAGPALRARGIDD